LKQQHTIDHDIELAGRGLFTGENVTMHVRAGAPHTGICFIRTDQSPPIRIPARVQNVSKRARRTALRNGTVSIETVEHWLSACAGLGIDNIQVELTGSELPAVDGSSLPFVETLRAAGICEQDATRETFVLDEVVRVTDGDSELLALPRLGSDMDTLEIAYDLDYGPDTPIGRQFYRVVVTPESFEANIAPARTFVLEEEAHELRAAGIGTHLSPKDILVLGRDGPIDNTLRFPDECVRHKILDLLGDLMLLGRFLSARIYARKSGHALNHSLVRMLFDRFEKKQREALLARPPAVDVNRVQRILPHRYPFLMIDRILEVEGSDRVIALKNVTVNEAFFQGHYPGDPIMPGVLIIEALAQAGGVLLSQELQHKGKVAVLLSLDKVKFRRPVRPGDQLLLEARTIRVRATTGHLKGWARVGGELAAEAEIKFILTDAESHGLESGVNVS